MITAKQLYNYLSNAIPKELSCEWDNDGLMCEADGLRAIKKVLIALDITDKTISYAKYKDCDVIVSHHPLIFRPLSALNDGNPVSKKAVELIKSNISAMSFHTRLDAVSGGVNDVLAGVLGLLKVETFDIGRIGELPKPIEFEKFASEVKSALGCPAIAFVGGEKDVKKVVVLGGDGKDLAGDFLSSDADTYITGSLSYNVMCDLAESGKNVIAAGHFYTENPVCGMLKAMIEKLSDEIECEIFDSNPIKYI